MEIRHITVLTPALAQAAGLLTLTIFLVERMRYTENGQVDVKAVDSPIGPWQVTFPLRAGTVEGSAEHTRVIPIAEQLLLDSVGMSILSLELSPFGFRVIARLDWSGRTGPFPRTVWHATDDLGGVYRTANCAGAGGGAMPQDACDSHPRSWRMSCVFSRPVNPDASRLELRVEEVSFQTLIRDDDPGAQPRWEQSGLIGNMGTLTIDLT